MSSAWQPGLPVLTPADKDAWQAWRQDRKRQQQRQRRADNPRIDYYPDARALQLIRTLTTSQAGGDTSSVINRIVSEWAERGRRK
jgi:hypothetical protein